MSAIKKSDLALLRLFGPDTYGIALGKDGPRLEKLGLVQWVPPKFGTTHWQITDAGRAVAGKAEAE